MVRKSIVIWAIILLVFATTAALTVLLFRTTDGGPSHPSEEKNFLWFVVVPEVKGGVSESSDDKSASIRVDRPESVSYGYLEGPCDLRTHYSLGDEEFDGNYSVCVPASAPPVRIDPNEYVSLAGGKIKSVDPTAELESFNYMAPDATQFYFGVQRPYAMVVYRGAAKEYVTFYDMETKKEAAFFEDALEDYPLCKTIASTRGGMCSRLRFQSCDMLYSNEANYFWGPALRWMNSTKPESRMLTWWDYHLLCSVVGGRETFPNASDMKEINVAADILMTTPSEEEAAAKVKETGADYVVLDWTLVGKSGALSYIATSDETAQKEGAYTGYLQCSFNSGLSQIKPSPEKNDSTGEISMVSSLFFQCNADMGLLFEIRDQSFSPDGAKVVTIRNGMAMQIIPWKTWREQSGSSVLGAQSFRNIIGNVLGYPNRYVNIPMFTTLVYVQGPQESTKVDLNNALFTRLYLGDHLEEYQELGLADPEIKKPERFRLVDGFEGDVNDSSYWGFVKVYEVL